MSYTSMFYELQQSLQKMKKILDETHYTNLIYNR